MYMFYLLGYKYFGDLENMESYYDDEKQMYKSQRQQKRKEFVGYGTLLKNVDEKLRKKVNRK